VWFRGNLGKKTQQKPGAVIGVGGNQEMAGTVNHRGAYIRQIPGQGTGDCDHRGGRESAAYYKCRDVQLSQVFWIDMGGFN
jgi:hypothetical protein